MTQTWHRFSATVALALLGAGILVFMVYAITRDGTLQADDGGWLAAAFLSLREVFSKIETVTIGARQ